MRKNRRYGRVKCNEKKPNIDRSCRAEGDGLEKRSQTQTEICCLAGGSSHRSQLHFVWAALPYKAREALWSVENFPEPQILEGEGHRGGKSRATHGLWAMFSPPDWLLLGMEVPQVVAPNPQFSRMAQPGFKAIYFVICPWCRQGFWSVAMVLEGALYKFCS